MNCKNCGALLNPSDKFCQNCGKVVEGPVDQMNTTTNMGATFTNVNADPSMAMPSAGNGPETVQPLQQAQPINQNYSMATNQNPKNNNILIIIMGVVIVILLVIIVVFALNTNKTDTTKKTEEGKTTTQPTTTQVSNTTNYVAGDYTYAIPNEYTVETEGDVIKMYDDEKAIWLEALAGYSLSMLSLDEVKTNLESLGITVLESKKQTYNGVEMMIFGGEYAGDKHLLAYANIDNGILYAEIININGEFDYDALENEVATMAKSAKYKASSNSIATNNVLDKLEKIIKNKKKN